MPPLVSLLASFSTFAVGFLARPVGGIVFGHFGDRLGRKKALVTALLMMGLATTLIGCLPTYATAGAAAPVLLIVLRFIQGLAIGGQWGGAMLLVTENAPKSKRGYYGAFAQAGAPVGVVLANLAFLLVTANMSPESFMSWGWRIPFASSVVLIALSLYVQLRLEDTPAFKRLEELKTRHLREALATVQPAQLPIGSPVIEALRTYPKQIALAAGAFLSVQVTFYILITFVIAYGTNAGGLNLPRSTMLTAVLIASLAQVPALFAAAAFSDRFGRRGIYMAGAVLMGFWGFAVFPLIDTGSLLWITVGIGGGQLIVAMMADLRPLCSPNSSSTHVRYSGASLGYQFGAIFGGALAPDHRHCALAGSRHVGISIYIAIASAITWFCIFTLGETHRNRLQAHDVGQAHAP
jgi:MFS family permease